MILTTITNTVYGHSLLLLASLLLVTLFTRFDQSDLLTYGLYFFVVWFFVEFILVLRSDHYWQSILQLLLATVAAIIFYAILNFICEKLGTSATSDGAGFGIILPGFLFIIFFVISLFIKGIMIFWAKIF